MVARLRELGAQVHAHVRPDSSQREHWRTVFAGQGARVELVPWEPEAMRAALRACAPNVVFSLLGTTQARARAAARAGGAPADYAAVDVGLTLQLLAAAQALPVRPRFVYLSSIGAGPNARGAYLQARARVEAELRAGGVPFTIARPSFITGSDRDESRPGERISAAVGDTALAVIGVLGGRRLAERWSSTSNTALAAALVRAALDPAAADRVLESEALRGALE